MRSVSCSGDELVLFHQAESRRRRFCRSGLLRRGAGRKWEESRMRERHQGKDKESARGKKSADECVIARSCFLTPRLCSSTRFRFTACEHLSDIHTDKIHFVSEIHQLPLYSSSNGTWWKLKCIFDFTSLRNFCLQKRSQFYCSMTWLQLRCKCSSLRENTMHLPHGDNCVSVGEWNRWRDFHGQKAAERCVAECRGERKTWLTPVRLGLACDSGHLLELTQDVWAWNYLGRVLMVSLLATNWEKGFMCGRIISWSM